jgi:secondary thiamine-phosphate synthase enzyme
LTQVVCWWRIVLAAADAGVLCIAYAEVFSLHFVRGVQGGVFMLQAIHHLHVHARKRGLIDITAQIREFVAEQEIEMGLLTIFCRHTSASLLIQENADPSVRTDIERYFETIVPEDAHRYEHDTEGPDDMPAHLRTALTQVQLSVPVEEGRLLLGTWQGIYLFEHRREPQTRNVVLHLLGT